MKCTVYGCPRKATHGSKCSTHHYAETVGEEGYQKPSASEIFSDWPTYEEAAHDDMQQSVCDDLNTSTSDPFDGGGESGGGGAGGDF